MKNYWCAQGMRGDSSDSLLIPVGVCFALRKFVVTLYFCGIKQLH